MLRCCCSVHLLVIILFVFVFYIEFLLKLLAFDFELRKLLELRFILFDTEILIFVDVLEIICCLLQCFNLLVKRKNLFVLLLCTQLGKYSC